MLAFMTLLGASSQFEKSITPSKVYQKVMKLHEEVHLIKHYFGIEKEPELVEIKTKLLPRHVWQRTYELFVKINILREKYNLSIIEPVNMEPTLNLTSVFTYEQVLRLLQEVKILKLRLGISKESDAITPYHNKTSTDVYNLLNIISRDFDLINGKEFTPSYVFSEALRIYEDFQVIFNKLKLEDQTTPPLKDKNARVEDSYRMALELLGTIKEVEVKMGLESIDFDAFKRNNITSSDVFEITQAILAQLQMIKAHIGLIHAITRGAQKQRDKSSADVAQMLGWLLKKSNKLSQNIR